MFDFQKDKINFEQAKAQWTRYYNLAVKNMKMHEKCSNKILIEIAAQHPLLDGIKPSMSFVQRLDRGLSLYQEMRANGAECNIYVPGSIHIGDHISLSRAGIQYLLSSGQIAKKDIIDDSANERIKGEQGVYNSADECFVASKLFLEGNYKGLICVCSANQLLRKKLFYIRFGVIPSMWSVPDDSFHSDIDEIFDAIPNVLFKDNDWQQKYSEQAVRTRLERKPGYIKPDMD